MKIQRMGEKIDWKPEMFEPLTPEQQAKALIDASFTAGRAHPLFSHIVSKPIGQPNNKRVLCKRRRTIFAESQTTATGATITAVTFHLTE
jgi:hypothetical protein